MGNRNQCYKVPPTNYKPIDGKFYMVMVAFWWEQDGTTEKVKTATTEIFTTKKEATGAAKRMAASCKHGLQYFVMSLDGYYVPEHSPVKWVTVK